MANRDSILYELKPESGDSSPHNEIGGGNIASGGTITLVDRGGGDWAWQFTGSDSMGNGLSVPYSPSGSDGLTMAVRLKITTNPSTGFTRYVQIRKSTDTSVYMGLTENGTNAVRSRFSSSGSGGSGFSGIGSTETTFVFRVKENGGSAEVIDTWKETVGRSGTAADASATLATTLSATFDEIRLGGGSGTVQIKRVAVFDMAKTDAECASCADDITAFLADGATVTLDIDCAETSDTVSVAVDVAVELDVGYTESDDTVAVAVTVDGSPVELDIDVAETSDTVLCTVDVVNPSVDVDVGYTEASDTVSVAMSVGTVLVTRIFKNNTGTARASVSGVKLAIYDATTKALVAHLTGLTTDSNGRLTVSHVDIVSGTTYAYEADFTVAGFGRRLPTAVAA